MKSIKHPLLALFAGASLVTLSLAQPFSSGSDGSYGAINVTTGTTLDLPTNGIFNCTTITVASGQTLTFRKNALNTPIYLLATGDVSIAGTISVAGAVGSSVSGGESGPGGFNGGSPGSVSSPSGSGYGPGAGRGGAGNTLAGGAGSASYATIDTVDGQSTNKGSAYGSALLVPVVGGSGGGGTDGTPGSGGGGGGGGILVASTTRITITGAIIANGGNSSGASWNGGSGGAIRLVAPAVTGNGGLFVAANGAGAGRIRVDTLNRTGLAFNFQPGGITSIGSLMLVFPTPTPRLDIVDAAGTAVPVGSGPVIVNLPFGSTPSRTVTVQAQDFNAVVPINVVLTPDNGSPVTYPATIDNQAANPAQVVVNVTVPINVQTAVNAWTR